MDNINKVKKTRIMPDNHWDWSMPTPFSQGWKIGNFIFTGGQVALDVEGNTIGVNDIEKQTRVVFEYIETILNEAGADTKDIIKLNTYYVFEGEKHELVDFWEKMTKVRMDFLSEPGPSATAVRVAGLAYPDLLIEVEAIAYISSK